MDTFSKLGFNTLDIAKLSGVGFSDPNRPCLTRLVRCVDQFIELHTCLLTTISFSKEFDKALQEEMKAPPLYGINTLVGDAVVVIRQDQKMDINCLG